MTEEQIGRVMIDKQKLLQWIEDKLYVYSTPYIDAEDEVSSKGKVNLLHRLDMDIRAGNLDVEEVAHERTTASSASAART